MDNGRWIARLGLLRLAAWPVFAALAAWTAWAVAGDPYGVRPRRGTQTGAKDLTIETPRLAPVEDLLATARRREMFRQSLVYETRKVETVNALGDMKFLGVARIGSNLRAILMNSKTGQSAFYGQGDVLEDLQVREIHEDRVTFSHGEQTLELRR